MINEGWQMKKSKKKVSSASRLWRGSRIAYGRNTEGKWEGVLKVECLHTKQPSPHKENSLEPGIYHLDNSEGSNPSRKTEKQGRTTVAYRPINIPRIKSTYHGILLAGSWRNSSMSPLTPTHLHRAPIQCCYCLSPNWDVMTTDHLTSKERHRQEGKIKMSKWKLALVKKIKIKNI